MTDRLLQPAGLAGRAPAPHDLLRLTLTARPEGHMDAIVPQSQRWYYDEWHLSPMIIHGGLGFLSGVTGSRPDGTCADSYELEFVEAFEKLGDVLQEAGLGYAAVLEMTTYHINMVEHLDLFRRVKDSYFVEPWPAWSAIGVSELAAPGASVEIRTICRAPME